VKRVPALLGVLAAATIALAGCSSTASTTASDSKVAPTNLKASITYAYWDPTQGVAMKQIIAAFNKKYPDIKVTPEVTPYAQYFTKLQTEASSNTLPDVFWMNIPTFQLYAANGQLAPMDNLVTSKQVDLSNYPSALTKTFNYGGKQYGVPKDVDTDAMWVNKSLFKEAGLAIPTAGWTWTDYKNDAKIITDKLGKKGVFGTSFELSGQTTWYNSIYEAGGYVISPNGKKSGWDLPATQQGIQLWADIEQAGDSPSVQQLSETLGYQWFTSGKSAMYPSIAGASVALMASSAIKADITAVPLPKDKNAVSVGHSITNVVAAKSKNLEAAQAFQAFAASKEGGLIQAKLHVANPAFKGTSTAFVDSVPGFNLQVFEDAVATAKPYPASKNTAVWATPESTLIPEAISGKISVKSATEQLAAEMNKALAKE
jgi:multiple sugar transport system substrate-binding protein